MTPALTPVKSLKTTYNGHLVKRRNTEIFSLDLLIPTTCHSKKLKFRPPMENPRPALRGGVAGRGARKRPPAFILHIFRPPVHLPLSVVLIPLDGAHRPHAFDTAASAVSGGLLPFGQQQGYTAAHRPSR